MSLGQPKIRIIKPSQKFAQKAINIAFSQLRLLCGDQLLVSLFDITNNYINFNDIENYFHLNLI